MKILGCYLNIGQKSSLLQFIQFAIQNHRPISDVKSNTAVNTHVTAAQIASLSHTKYINRLLHVCYILDYSPYLNALHSHFEVYCITYTVERRLLHY